MYRLLNEFDSILSTDLSQGAPSLLYDRVNILIYSDKDKYKMLTLVHTKGSDVFSVLLKDVSTRNVSKDPSDDAFDIESKRQHIQLPFDQYDSFLNERISDGWADVTGKMEQINIQALPDDFEEYRSILIGKRAEDLLARLSYYDDEGDGFLERLEHYESQKEKIFSQFCTGYCIPLISTIEECKQVLEELSKITKKRNVAKMIAEFNQKLKHLLEIMPLDRLYNDYYYDGSPNDSLETTRSNMKQFLKKKNKDLLRYEWRRKAFEDLEEPKVVLTKEDMELRLADNPNIEVREADQALIDMVKQKLASISGKYKTCYYVINKETQSAYDTNRANVSGNHNDEMLLWHGSTNNNWYSIVTTGLEPREAKNGHAYGKGIYFAPDAFKSMGYTSIDGSKWAKGGKPFGFLGLYRVRTGVSLNPHGARQFTLEEITQKGYDSVYAAAGGGNFRYDEVVVYDKAQCTIFALVEIGI